MFSVKNCLYSSKCNTAVTRLALEMRSAMIKRYTETALYGGDFSNHNCLMLV